MIGLTEDELTKSRENLDRIHKRLVTRLDSYNKLKKLITKQRKERKNEAAAADAKKATSKKLRVHGFPFPALLALHLRSKVIIEGLDPFLRSNRRRDSVNEL